MNNPSEQRKDLLLSEYRSNPSELISSRLSQRFAVFFAVRLMHIIISYQEWKYVLQWFKNSFEIIF